MAIKHLNGKTVFITGAASGIGAATAVAFARQGCSIIGADLDARLLRDTSLMLSQLGARFEAVELDVSSQSQWQEVISDVIRQRGLPRVLVNNAGIGVHGSLLNTPIEAVRQVMEVNFYGVLYGCRALLPHMLESGDHCQLVNVASLASIAPMPNMSAYAATKYAVDGISEVLALELQKTKVGVTCVHPGVINTPIVNGNSYNLEFDHEARQRLGAYYRKHGSDPAVVGEGIVKAVRSGKAHLYIGAKAPLTVLFKRLSPALLRRLSYRSAAVSGYL